MWAFLYTISVCVQKTSTIAKKGSLPLGPATNEGSRVRDLVDSLKKGDSPRCGEMSRSDKGDSLPSGSGCEQREQTEGLN